MEIMHISTLENDADICTKNLDGENHTQIRESLWKGVMKAWTNYDKLIASMHWREDVKKRDRVASLIQSIKESMNELDNLNDDSDGEIYNKRMKISWH